MTIEELQQEVRKVYPDAWMRVSFGKYWIYRDYDWTTPIVSVGHCDSEYDAWLSAYQSLKEQKKV